MKYILLICYILFSTSCDVQRNTKLQKKKINDFTSCEDCTKYIHKLKKELSTCGYSFDDNIPKKVKFEDCKFDANDFVSHTPCFLGKKRSKIESLFGNRRHFFINCDDCNDFYIPLLFTFEYTRDSILRKGSFLGDTINMDLVQIPCLSCDKIYDDIKTMKSISVNEENGFLDKFGGCLFGKSRKYLESKVHLKIFKEKRNRPFVNVRILELILNNKKVRYKLTYVATNQLLSIYEMK